MKKFHIIKGRYALQGDSKLARYISHRYINSSLNNFENEIVNETEQHGTYGATLFDPLWKAKRSEILKRDLHKCVICSSTEKLEVHHRQYHYLVVLKKFKAPWEYENHLLITLCTKCHGKGHSKFKVPIVKI